MKDEELMLNMAKSKDGEFPVITTVSKTKKNKKVTRRPVLLLDVDGVLNVFDKHGVPLEYHHQHQMWDTEKTNWCSLAKGTTARFQELNKLFEIHWCTAWNYNANHLGPILGFKELNVCPINIEHYNRGSIVPNLAKKEHQGHWKLESIETYVDENFVNVPIAFIDDEINSDEWAKERNKTCPTIFIKTNGQKGITEKEMFALREFHAYATREQGTRDIDQTLEE